MLIPEIFLVLSILHFRPRTTAPNSLNFRTDGKNLLSSQPTAALDPRQYQLGLKLIW